MNRITEDQKLTFGPWKRGWWLSWVAMMMWQAYQALERSLKVRRKWNVKMKAKMMIFEKSKGMLDFTKMTIFRFILVSF